MAQIYNPPMMYRDPYMGGGQGGYGGPQPSLEANIQRNVINPDLMRQMYQQQSAGNAPQARITDPNDPRLDVVYQPPVSETAQGKLLDIQKRSIEDKSGQQDYLNRLKAAELGLKEKKLSSDTNIKQQRADVYAWKSKNPNHIIKIVGDKIVGIDPQTNQVTDLGDSGGMDEKDKIELQQQGRIEGIAAQGDQRMRQITAQGEIGDRQITARGDEQRKTNAAKPPTAQTSTQERVQQYLKARQAANDPNHPEWRRFLTIGDNDFQIQEPGGFMSNESDTKTINDIYNHIYGSARGTTTGPTIETDTSKLGDLANKKPPAGAKPGGKYVNVPGYGLVYKES